MSRLRNLLSVLALIATFAALPASAQPRADILLLDRAEASKAIPGAPKRGTTMTQVEATLGTPEQKLEPRGGQRPQWPVIHRWVYPQFVVYFEKSSVVDVVARSATPGEIGPKPID